MSNSASSKRKFLAWSAVAIVAAGFTIVLSSSSITHARHHLTNSLVSRGTTKSGSQQVAWYALAHVVSPNDPATALLLAAAQLQQGSPSSATKLLGHYPGYLPAVVERGEILVQQEDFDQAIVVLSPVSRQSALGAYWLAIGQSEVGQGSAALATLSKTVVAQSQSAALLRDLLLLADGKTPDAAVSSPEAVETLAQARSGVLPLALKLYDLGLLNTSERVLVESKQTALPIWVLEGRIALSHSVPDTQAAEGDYYQAFLLDPTNVSVQRELKSLATKLTDQTMLNKISQAESLLPTR